MSILNNRNITPVNALASAIVSKASNATVINVATLPLFTDGNDQRATALQKELTTSTALLPKIRRAKTPREIAASLPNILELYKEASGKSIPSTQITQLRSITLGGTIFSIKELTEAIVSKFFVDGKNTRSEHALAYAEYFKSLATTLADYSTELEVAGGDFAAANRYKYEELEPLAEILKEQTAVEQAFTDGGSTWEQESERRELAAKTERMLASFDKFEAWQSAQTAGAVDTPVEAPANTFSAASLAETLDARKKSAESKK